MISKLRKKLIAINIVSVGIVFFLASLLIFSLGLSKISEERRERMMSALSYDEADGDFSSASLYSDMALLIHDKATGENRWLFGSNVSADTDQILESGQKVLEGKLDRGYARMRIRFIRTEQADEVRVVLNDLDSTQNGLSLYLLVAIITVSVGLIFCFAISFMLASVALRPIEDSWAKQKQFVADASHELKTPLSVIMANTEIIASHKEETVGSQMKWIRNTQEESQRMAVLVADLLFLAKNDDGVRVQMTSVNFSDCVGTSALGYDAVFYENGKSFDYKVQQDVIVHGNEGQIKQLVNILLDNANKYSVDEGNIRLSLSIDNKKAVLSVSNDSPELSSEQLSHLFDRFYTVDESRNTKGNGLGLSIAKQICQTHGGTIYVLFGEGRITFNAVLPVLKKNRSDDKNSADKSKN